MRSTATPCLLALALVATSAQAGPRKSLVIALDGTRADGIVSADTPEIDRLLAGRFGDDYRGAFGYAAQTIQDAPTSSAYNHCSIMTGVSGAKHGVDANNAAALAAVDYTAYPHYLTLLEQDDPSRNTAYLVTWSDDTAIVSGADYIKDSSDAANVDRVVAMIAGTHDDPAGDDGTAWALGTEPDAIFLFLDDGDAAGHGYGFWPAVPEYLVEMEELDAQLGTIFAAIEARPTFASEDWQIVITSDHGGLGTGHGGFNPNSETIPFIVVGRANERGYLGGGVHNMDAAPTALAHMLGMGALPPHYDGRPQGGTVLPPAPLAPDDQLVLHLGFEGDLLDGSARGNHATIAGDSDHDPQLIASGGLCGGGYLSIPDNGGGATDASYLTLGNPPDLDFGVGVDYSVAVWLRATADQSGDSVIIGNKDWASGANIGTLLLANEGNGADFGLNVADAAGRKDIEAIDFGLDSWWFVTASVDRDGDAVLFVGDPGGLLFIISDRADDLGDLDSPLPWNIGQDGTGSYPYNLGADLDELRIWRRAISLDEVRRLYQRGAGLCGVRLLRNAEVIDIAGAVTPSLATILPLDSVDDLHPSPVAPGMLLDESAGPLVFYALDPPVRLMLTHAPGGAIRLTY